MKVEDFFPYVLVDVLGCPDPSLRIAIVSAAAEFCRETLAWTEVQDPILLENGVSSYEMDTPLQAYASTVRSAYVGARPLTPITPDVLRTAMPDWATAQSTEPVYFNQTVERGFITVYPTPYAVTTQALSVTAAFVPTIAATSLPDFLGQRHVDVIASGAKARLMMTPLTAWSNPSLAAYHRQLFDAGVIDARISEAHGRVPGSLRAQSRKFGS